ncbi:MAG: DUF6077 domain-containing protein [Lachnospiraceae bacterium]|nr:DUF6077 domain-containing protein [Lachnospiraceae bacterium]
MHILQMILQLLSLTLWLLIIPFGVGLLPARFLPKERRTWGVVFLLGYIIFFAVFELVALIVTLNVIYDGLTILLKNFTPIVYVLAGIGFGTEMVVPAVFKRIRFKSALKSAVQFLKEILIGKTLTWEAKIIWLFFLMILGFQLFMSLIHASFDGDDAYYIVQSLTAVERDVLFRIDAYTGSSTALNPRHAMAAFPLWLAMIAEKARIHPTILAHSIIPLFLLPMTYLIYFQIGKSLLKSKLESLPIFMVLIAVMQMFGNVSIYTNETFLMTRTWQGKSFAANFIVPAIIWLFLVIGENLQEDKDHLIYYILLGSLIWAAGISSSMAVFLSIILTGALSFYLAIFYRKFKILFKSLLACIPGFIFMLIYYLIKIV